MVRSWLLAFAAMTVAPAPASAAAAAGAPLRIVDTTPDFARLYAETRKLPPADRGAAFRKAFDEIVPGFYSPRRSGFKDVALYDKLLMKKVDSFPDRRAGVEEVSRRFGQLFQPALQRFEAQFGPMRGYPAIYLVDSLGEFDGGTRELNGVEHLMFGADMIGKLHLKHDIEPFFHHELFHIYHARTFTPCDAIWCNLWVEGLAVYVASRLNPNADDAELLLTEPKPIRSAVDAHRQEAVCAVRTRLDSTDDKDSRALFSSGELTPHLPPRFGYYVGYLLVRDIGRHRTLKQLAALDEQQARPLTEASLRGMAPSCPPPSRD